MSRKELKRLAEKIAELEKNHMKSNSSKIEEKIEKLITDANLTIFEMIELDVMVLEILEK